MKLIVTGGAGFIGAALIRHAIRHTDAQIVNIDKLTYAATPEALEEAADSPRHRHIRADIADAAAMRGIFDEVRPDAVMHLAAESHVDRSIDTPADFVTTNVVGTYTLLEAARAHRDRLPADRADTFRFHHVSTDEVFGDLTPEAPPFTEASRYAPSSPYAATKAGSDHLVRAWGRTYGLPVVISNCSNNYGPWQFPEKLIPTVVIAALQGHPLPVYGDGAQLRDWLHVEDHARALWAVLTRGTPGRTYAVGGNAERSNLQVVQAICAALDARRPDAAPHARLIEHVADRPGHDRRYSIDASRIRAELGWAPRESFETGLAGTVDWYLDNAAWWQDVRARRYDGRRLGAGATGS